MPSTTARRSVDPRTERAARGARSGRRRLVLAGAGVELADDRPGCVVALHLRVEQRIDDPAQDRQRRPAPRADDAGRAARSRGRSPRRHGRAQALAQRLGDVSSMRVGQRIGVDRPAHHLGVDEAEVGDARAGAVRDELHPQRASELLDGGLAHRVGHGPDAVDERVDRGDDDDVAPRRDDLGQRGVDGAADAHAG